MTVFPEYKQTIASLGFSVLEDIYSVSEIEALIESIELTDRSKPAFRKSTDLFAIRQFLKEVPQTLPLIFNARLLTVINHIFGDDYFVVKSIYFDKPGGSNWFVPYHQDLTISVENKVEVEGYGPWTVKPNQYAVQPPLHILESSFTIRIHLDDTDGNNGALRVLPASHLNGIVRPDKIDRPKETEVTCSAKKGAIMLMKPLLLHASSRTTNGKKRRVIHIEFSNKSLPHPLRWSELQEREAAN